MWISRTPLRVSFLGGGTDYPSYFRDRPGAVLGGTIDKYVYTQALPLPGFAEQRFRVTYRTTESVNSVDDLKHPVVRESLRHYEWNDPINIATMSDIPGGTGLGSSSAFTVGFINLLHHMRGKELTRYELARQAIRMEQEILRENVGVQDQVHAAFGGLARYEFIGDSISIQPLRLSTDRMSHLNSCLLLVFTGAQRSASQVVASQEERTKSGANEEYLRELYEMTSIGARLLENEGDDATAVREFADLVDLSWQLKRRLGPFVSSPGIDAIYDEGRAIGAYGGKLLGAGGGGFVLFLAEPHLHDAFAHHFGPDRVMRIAMTNGGSIVSHMR